MELCKLEECNKDNLKHLSRYETICRNKGLTDRSIEAFCKGDIPLYLRYIKDKPLEQTSHIDIEDFFDYCTKERKNGDAALDRKYVALNSFFKAMIKKEYLDMKNPLDKVDPIKVRTKIRDFLTDDEIQAIYDFVKGDKRGLALTSLLFSSGCRLSELYQLNKASLDFTTRRFKVLGKGDKEGVCIFSEFASEKIKEYLAPRKDDIPALFLSRQHNRWSKKAIQCYVKNAGVRSGIIKNVHPHIFRHGRAMSLLKKGAPLDVIQNVLRHASIATTQIYAHQNINDVQDKIDQLDNALKGR